MGASNSNHTRLKWTKVSLVVLIGAATAYGFESGPPASRTGAPGEATCTECHRGTANSGPGRVTIDGVPPAYEPNVEYLLKVRVSDPDRRRWGFQVTALDSTNKGAGTLILVNRTLTRLSNGTGTFSGRMYVSQTSSGTFANTSGGAEWEVMWKAPATDLGLVTFYAAGNAANNNGDDDPGDRIYTASVRSGRVTPVVVGATYKKGKLVLSNNGSNIVSGATVVVTGGSTTQAETFNLTANPAGTKWQVKKTVKSTPGQRTIDQVWPASSTITIVIHNPDGSESTPTNVSR